MKVARQERQYQAEKFTSQLDLRFVAEPVQSSKLPTVLRRVTGCGCLHT